jgi:hypothetical protein
MRILRASRERSPQATLVLPHGVQTYPPRGGARASATPRASAKIRRTKRPGEGGRGNRRSDSPSILPASLAAECGRERGGQFVSDAAPVATPSPLAHEAAQLRLRTGLSPRATVHEGMRTAKRRVRAAEENDVDQRARIVHAAHAARTAARHHDHHSSRDLARAGKFGDNTSLTSAIATAGGQAVSRRSRNRASPRHPRGDEWR